MRTREAGYKDYKIKHSELHILMERCKEEKNIMFLKEAVHESNDMIEEELFLSLHDGISYEDLEIKYNLKDTPFVAKNDFYAYRRKALFIFKEKLKENNIEIRRKWEQDNCIRRYLTVENASKEISISLTDIRRLARKANALLSIGNLVRIEMIALYKYLDNENKCS